MTYNIKEEKAEKALEVFVEEFYYDRSSELVLVKNYLANAEFEKIRALAHKWSGFSAPYGFHRLAKLSKQLELSSSQQQHSQTKHLINQVTQYLDAKGNLLRK